MYYLMFYVYVIVTLHWQQYYTLNTCNRNFRDLLTLYLHTLCIIYYDTIVLLAVSDDDLNTYQVVQWCIGKKGAYILKVRLLMTTIVL